MNLLYYFISGMAVGVAGVLHLAEQLGRVGSGRQAAERQSE